MVNEVLKEHAQIKGDKCGLPVWKVWVVFISDYAFGQVGLICYEGDIGTP